MRKNDQLAGLLTSLLNSGKKTDTTEQDVYGVTKEVQQECDAMQGLSLPEWDTMYRQARDDIDNQIIDLIDINTPTNKGTNNE